MQILVFIIILSVLVLIHELGHFTAAKLFGVRVEEFGIGLPPRAKTLGIRKGTIFSLNWLPLGGFVRLKGEDADEIISGADTFYEKPIWQRTIMLLAGVVMNFVLGVILFGTIYTVLGIPTKTDSVRVVEIVSNSPAAEAGIRLEEKVSKFSIDNNQVPIKETGQLVGLVNQNAGKEIKLILTDKEGKEREVNLIPRENPPEGEGALGVVLSNVELVKYPIWQMPFRGVVVGMEEALSWGKEIVLGLWILIGRLIRGEGVGADVAGPIGIYQVSKQVYQFGILAVLQFVGVLSVNLAILNIIPFPALDGGRIAFLVVEKILGRRIKNKIEGTVHAVGMVVLISLMVLITVRDVIKIFKI